MPNASLTFKSANCSSVTFEYGGTGWHIPANESEHDSGWSTTSSSDTRQTQTKTITQVVYDVSGCTTTWSWTFTGGNGGSSSSKEGSKTIYGMNAGSRGTVTGRLTASRSAKQKKEVYTRTRTRTKTTEKDDKGNTTTTYGEWSDWSETGPRTTYGSASSKYLGSASDTLTFYTQPAEFSWGAGVAQGETIQTSIGLSASSWNTLVTRTEQRDNWKDQSGGASYSDAKVSSGELITAAKYNILAKALGVSQVKAHTDKVTGTLITAAVFIALSTAVNK